MPTPLKGARLLLGVHSRMRLFNVGDSRREIRFTRMNFDIGPQLVGR
jgi:hypothetical protein